MADRFRSVLWPAAVRERWILVAILLGALLLRLQVWHWREFYPLGGDEQEYFDQALRLLRGEGYRELRLMRPPLYPIFLAGVFQIFDSQVQRVRLVQALISTGTVYLQWLLTRLALRPAERADRAALLAAGLVAAGYTLAANATELLTETTFLFCFALVVALLFATRAPTRRLQFAIMAGVVTGMLTLLRSVALPLLPLGGLWLLLEGSREHQPGALKRGERRGLVAFPIAVAFVLAGVAVIAPWTARNYLRYGKAILVDTTGAENLWLDNDPAGREAVKAELYALGEDRGARQSLSLERGLAAITGDPARFTRKVGGEALKFVALEYFDDLRERPGIWVPPLEVWLRLLLGDGLWLLLAIVGSMGLWLLRDWRLQWLIGLWSLYTLVTSLLFHVELRYRLPLYPMLALTTASLLARSPREWYGGTFAQRAPTVAGAATAGLLVTLMLLHRPYLREGAMLAQKHWHLWRGDGAAALATDPESALARVELALAAIRGCRVEGRPCPQAEALLGDAIAAKPAHPYAHLLLGGLLRQRGDDAAARGELGFETASLEDLQQWMQQKFGVRALERIDVGGGLDLGDITGFYAPDESVRWTTDRATIALRAPDTPAVVRLRLAAGAGGSQAPVMVRVSAQGTELGRLEVGPRWQTYELSLPTGTLSDKQPGETFSLLLEMPTVRPRAIDPAGDDNRSLGVQVDWVEVAPRGQP